MRLDGKDGKTYRWMGAEPEDAPAMEQTGLEVTPTHTVYEFAAEGVNLRVEFFTPRCPTTWMFCRGR